MLKGDSACNVRWLSPLPWRDVLKVFCGAVAEKVKPLRCKVFVMLIYRTYCKTLTQHL